MGAPTAGEVHVWIARLDDVPEAAALMLSEAERLRAARMRADEPRRRFVASHVVLRLVLARYTPTVELAEDARAKPYLVGGAGMPRFNLSHSGSLALVAVACDEVGVDVERVRSLRHAAGVADRVLSPGERRHLVPLDTEMLLRAWVRKEAVVKATGEGLRRPLSEVEVSPAPEHVDWWVDDVPVPSGYVAAVAGLGPRPGPAGLVVRTLEV